MIRTLLIEAALFLTPFVLYALILQVTRRSAAFSQWSLRGILLCAVAAVALMLAGLLLFERESGAPPGSRYIPAETRDGVFHPGRYQ